MVSLHTWHSVYFLGIGGIGMSALARFFLDRGVRVAGYDLSPSDITDRLSALGASIHFEEDIAMIPDKVDMVIYTPAIRSDHAEYRYLEKRNIPFYKRSQILGMISENYPTIAVAGTHGKTSTSAMAAHILHPEYKIMAFIGGISKNLDSNFISDAHFETIIAEADEYDRSFLTLHPQTAVITSLDADHLDIYSVKKELEHSFQLFADQIKDGGSLVIHEKIAHSISHPCKITYGFSKKADLYADNIRLLPDRILFSIHDRGRFYEDITLGVPGDYNLLNALAAYAAVTAEYTRRGKMIDPEYIFGKLATFSGVKRRFDYQVFEKECIYIDDYAHHPEEIRSLVHSVKTIFPGKNITGIFQPHLYSRTRDFGKEFASALELLDEIILLDIYPAREKPLKGITSRWLAGLIRGEKTRVMNMDEVLPYLQNHKPQIVLTIGAGNIDRLVPVLKKGLSSGKRNPN